MEEIKKNDVDMYTLDELQKNLLHICPRLADALEKPAVENPFKLVLKHKVEFSIMFFLRSILAIFRMIVVVLSFLATNLVAHIILLGHKEQTPAAPMTGYRRIGQAIMWKIMHFSTFAAGYHRINIKGEYAGREKAPILVVAPHSAVFDDFFVSVLGNVSFVSRIENKSVFVKGVVTRAFNPIYTDRSNPESRLEVVKEIKRRALDNSFRPMFVFPEGTTSNRKALIAFKYGAFYPGVPVQPVVIRHLNDEDYTSWTWEGPRYWRLVFAMCSRLENKLEVEYLPVYNPSKEEQEDPVLYASNVRKVMADHVSLPTTDHSFEDCRLMMEALNYGIPSEAGLVEYYKLSPLLRVKYSEIQEEFKRFAKINESKNGVISFQEFAEFFNLPRNDVTRTFFNIYDLNKEDGIRFREYLIGRYLITKTFSTEEYIQRYFQMMQGEKSFLKIIETSTKADRELISTLLEHVGKAKHGVFPYDEFKRFCQEYPECCLLFMHYTNVMESQKS